jgi:hypothetical protein
MSIRSRILRDNGIILGNQKGFGCKIEMISPSGIVYSDIYGRVVYSDVSIDQDQIEIVTNDPVVTISFEQLERIPEKGEKWIIRIPETTDSDNLISHTYERPPEKNDSFGFITLRLVKVDSLEIEEPIITSVDTDNIINITQNNVLISGSNFRYSGKIYLTDYSDFDLSNVVIEQEEISRNDTSIEFNVVAGGL